MFRASLNTITTTVRIWHVRAAVLLIVLFAAAPLAPTHAATICTGAFCGGAATQPNLVSDGSDGALVLSNNTSFDVSTDSIFNFTNISLSPGAQLDFSPVSSNTIYLLANGNVIISGTINVGSGSLVIASTGTITIGQSGGLLSNGGSFELIANQLDIQQGAMLGDTNPSQPITLVGDRQIILADPGTISITPVPLPGALVLFAPALGLLGILARRQSDQDTSRGRIAVRMS